MPSQRTFLFMPESAYGPTNNCIGIGNILLEKGHRVIFAAEASWVGRLSDLGFVEDLVSLAPPPPSDSTQDAGQFWTDFIRDTSPEFRKPTIEQLTTFIKPTWQALIDGAKYCQPQLDEIIKRQKPDVIIEDNVNCFPALVTAGVPFVRSMSCNPLEMRGENIPPTFSGYPANDKTGWEDFRKEYDRAHREIWSDYNEWVQSCGAPELKDLDFIHESKYLNLYLYPEALDYIESRPLGATWHRLDSAVRSTDAEFTIPEKLKDRSGALVYLSLGSLGSADIELMKRLVDVLSRTPHRYIVSKGPQHEMFELADNMWGLHQVPQTNVLPLVDLVITHGGNNTVAECVHFGKPMIVLPLFWDQYDNAQRVHESGFGIRLETYRFEEAQMHAAITRLLNDTALQDRLATFSAKVKLRSGASHAAELIERVAG